MVLLEGNAQMTIVIKITKGNDQIINLSRIKNIFKTSSFRKADLDKYIYTYIYNIHIYVFTPISIYYTHISRCRHMYDF